MAAERIGRKARLIEIDPRYCDVIIKRWEAATGRQATLAATGQTFQSLITQREREREATATPPPLPPPARVRIRQCNPKAGEVRHGQ